MKSYSFLIYKQSRVLLSILIFVILFFPIVLWPTQIKNSIFHWIISIIGEIILILVLRYFSIGTLLVTIENNKVKFQWIRKVLFNHTEIPTTLVSDIKGIVLDEGQYLRRIITDKNEILLGNGISNRQSRNDSKAFIRFLEKEIGDLEIKDSWDLWAEKGYLKWAYKINTILLIISILLMVSFISIKGFSSRHLLFMVFLLPQIILYQLQMKNRIKN